MNEMFLSQKEIRVKYFDRKGRVYQLFYDNILRIVQKEIHLSHSIIAKANYKIEPRQ